MEGQRRACDHQGNQAEGQIIGFMLVVELDLSETDMKSKGGQDLGHGWRGNEAAEIIGCHGET